MARRSKEAVSPQLSLFEGNHAKGLHGVDIESGSIVRQNWPWIGMYQVAYPYLQVHLWVPPKEPETDVQYLCHAVPYGSCPASLHWFPRRYLVPLGRTFEVPTRERETESWRRYYRQHMDDPWEEGWPREYMESIRELRVQTQPTGGASPFAKQGGCPWPDQAPFEWEREIVEFLDTLPVKWWEVSRGTWYEKFPEDLTIDNGIRRTLFAATEAAR